MLLTVHLLTHIIQRQIIKIRQEKSAEQWHECYLIVWYLFGVRNCIFQFTIWPTCVLQITEFNFLLDTCTCSHVFFLPKTYALCTYLVHTIHPALFSTSRIDLKERISAVRSVNNIKSYKLMWKMHTKSRYRYWKRHQLLE